MTLQAIAAIVTPASTTTRQAPVPVRCAQLASVPAALDQSNAVLAKSAGHSQPQARKAACFASPEALWTRPALRPVKLAKPVTTSAVVVLRCARRARQVDILQTRAHAPALRAKR